AGAVGDRGSGPGGSPVEVDGDGVAEGGLDLPDRLRGGPAGGVGGAGGERTGVGQQQSEGGMARRPRAAGGPVAADGGRQGRAAGKDDREGPGPEGAGQRLGPVV